MKLANLIYEIARDSIQIDSGFNFDGFVQGDFDEDRDYRLQISFAFDYVNTAITRLFTEKKTELKVEKAYSNESGYLAFDKGEILAIMSDVTPKYKRVKYKPFAQGVAIEAPYAQKIVYVEYRPFPPRFDMDSIRKQILNDENEIAYEEIPVELKDYGITDEMCSYIKEYAKSGLTEYLSPELSQRHLQLAEGYINSLKTRYSNFPHREIEDALQGGGAF